MEIAVVDVSIAEAKAKLSEIVAAVEAGETHVITRRGKVVAKIVPAGDRHPNRKLDVEALRKLTDSMPMANVSAGELVRQMRDDDRY
jgi:prevent-host-death family protein